MIVEQLTRLFAAAPNVCQAHSFFGLDPWYKYLTLVPVSDASGQQTCDIKSFTLLGSGSDIPLVLVAVIDDLLRVAGMVAVAFVIYGAIQFIASQGNPEQTARAQSTILNALIGLAVAVIAVVFVSFLGGKLGG